MSSDSSFYEYKLAEEVKALTSKDVFAEANTKCDADEVVHFAWKNSEYQAVERSWSMTRWFFACPCLWFHGVLTCCMYPCAVGNQKQLEESLYFVTNRALHIHVNAFVHPCCGIKHYGAQNQIIQFENITSLQGDEQDANCIPYLCPAPGEVIVSGIGVGKTIHNSNANAANNASQLVVPCDRPREVAQLIREIKAKYNGVNGGSAALQEAGGGNEMFVPNAPAMTGMEKRVFVQFKDQRKIFIISGTFADFKKRVEKELDIRVSRFRLINRDDKSFYDVTNMAEIATNDTIIVE